MSGAGDQTQVSWSPVSEDDRQRMCTGWGTEKTIIFSLLSLFFCFIQASSQWQVDTLPTQSTHSYATSENPLADTPQFFTYLLI